MHAHRVPCGLHPPQAPPATSRREFLGLAARAGASPHWIRVHRRAMACRFEVTLSGEDTAYLGAATDALTEADRLEAALTVFRDTSELVRVNRSAADGPIAVDRDLFDLLCRSLDLHERTGGAFDITTTPLSRCWGFFYRQGRLPSAEALEAAHARVGMDAVDLDRLHRTVRFSRCGLELNLGSIGKGYAVQRIGARLRSLGVSHALVTAGASSVLALGGRGDGWPIDVRSRCATRGRLARLRLRNGALGTSGPGEQFVEIGGRRYGHVLDPRTGQPAAGVLSATVVTGDAADADALATAFLVGGADLARQYCGSHRRTLALVLPDDGSDDLQVFGSYEGASLEEL